ncbi:MAG: hypothetical protein QW228_04675 [Candidatus Aenigmatarchaeota archaeon]
MKTILVLVRYFVMSLPKTVKEVMMKMIKSVLIFALLTYSVFITYKYAEAYRDKIYYKKQIEEFYRWYDFEDTVRVKIVEKEIPKEKFVYVPKYITQRETVKVYEAVPSRLGDTLATSFYWEWANFLGIRDTIKLYQQDNYVFRTKIYRAWKVLKPIEVQFLVFEKYPERFWYTAYINNFDLKDYVFVNATHNISSWRWYVGLGGVYYWEDGFDLKLQNSVVYDRFMLSLGVSKRSIDLTLNYRIR